MHARIERGQKWDEDKRAKKEMEIQRLENAKKTVIGRERRGIRESGRGSVSELQLNLSNGLPSKMGSGESVPPGLKRPDSMRLTLNNNSRQRLDLVKDCEGYVIEGGQCRSELLSPRVRLLLLPYACLEHGPWVSVGLSLYLSDPFLCAQHRRN